MIKKTKPKHTQSKTVDYLEGYLDGRNALFLELETLGLLKVGWKKTYNKTCKVSYVG